jgi:hypothetical protein
MRAAGASAKALLTIGGSLALLIGSASTGQSLDATSAVVTITSVSGYGGHAFVYAQVRDSSAVYPAPTGSGHQSPVVAEWVPQPIASASCPWVWAVYVFDRVTMAQLNAPAPNAPAPNFGTTTVVCAGPSSTPVAQPPVTDAAARLDLDLQVSVAPASPAAGVPSAVSARLSSALTQDLNLYLSMAIEDWQVSSWTLDFGDGQVATRNGSIGTAISLPHTYVSAGRYDARATAEISGHAQAAVYDRYGTVHLIQRSFSVAVGNHVTASVRPRPARSYSPPQATVAVIPSIGTAGGGSSSEGFHQIDALRGALTRLVVRLLIIREGVMRIDGVPRGAGQSRLTGWRLDGTGSDAPAGSGTVPGPIHVPAEPMYLQWNAPDHIVGASAQEYVVPVTLYVDTHFPDGRVGSYAIRSSFTVAVNFAAQSG